MYNSAVLKHFKNPHNYGEIKNADGVGKVGNIVCGDVMWLYIKVAEDERGKKTLKDVKFKTFGCTAAIATSSVITDLAKGKTIKEALELDKDKIVRSLGGLPPIKIHCSVLASDALLEAIYDYLSKNKKKVPKKLVEKHKRINRERKLIEEKYKDWVDMEEKLQMH